MSYLAQLRRYEFILDNACHNEALREFDAQHAYLLTLGAQPAIRPSEAFIKNVVAQLGAAMEKAGKGMPRHWTLS